MRQTVSEAHSTLITKMNDDLMSHRFIKGSDERIYNGEDLQARKRQEMNAFNPKGCNILTQTTSEDRMLK